MQYNDYGVDYEKYNYGTDFKKYINHFYEKIFKEK